jgi:hypothetical protein
MVAIFSEALVAEIVLSLMGSPRRFSFLLSGALGVTWSLVQPFVTGPLLFGRTLFVVWLDLLDTGTRLLGLDSNAALAIVAALLAIYLSIGGVAGWLSWDLSCQLKTRMGRAQLEALES